LTGEVLKDEALNLVLVRPVLHATRFEIIEWTNTTLQLPI
jgi:hypothetical protein